jgi:hypothetical protein
MLVEDFLMISFSYYKHEKIQSKDLIKDTNICSIEAIEGMKRRYVKRNIIFFIRC